MRRSIVKRRLGAFLAGLLTLATRAVHADPIQSPYTVTDLGTTPRAIYYGITPTYSTDASGNGIVIAPNGQTAYPFPQTLTSTMLPASEWASLPVPEPAPPVYSPSNGSNFSGALDAIQYSNGTVIAIDAVINGEAWQKYLPFYVPQGPDGSWGQPIALGQGYTHPGPDIGDGTGVQIVGLDKAGNVLMGIRDPFNYYQYDYNVYNIHTGSSVSISTLTALVNNGYSWFQAFGMDDDGRILLQADHWSGSGPGSTDLVFLTPAGVSSDPIATPEPGSLAVMAMAMAAFAVHRAQRRG